MTLFYNFAMVIHTYHGIFHCMALFFVELSMAFFTFMANYFVETMAVFYNIPWQF